MIVHIEINFFINKRIEMNKKIRKTLLILGCVLVYMPFDICPRPAPIISPALAAKQKAEQEAMLKARTDEREEIIKAETDPKIVAILRGPPSPTQTQLFSIGRNKLIASKAAAAKAVKAEAQLVVSIEALPITKAFYGTSNNPSCYWTDVTNKVKNSSNITSNNGNFGDPCPGTAKSLRIISTDGTNVVQENATIVYDANKVSKAYYGAGQAIDVTDQVRALLAKTPPSNAAFVTFLFDPAPGVQKKLYITYMDKKIGENGVVTFAENDPIVTPKPVPQSAPETLDSFKKAMSELVGYSNALAQDKSVEKLITLQKVSGDQLGIPALRLQIDNLIKAAPAQLKGVLPQDSLIQGLVDLMNNVSQALAAVSLGAQDIEAVKVQPAAASALQDAITALIEFAGPAAEMEKVFDAIIQKKPKKLSSGECVNLFK